MKNPFEIGLLSRRDFLRTLSGATALTLPEWPSNSVKPAFQDVQMASATGPADLTLRIGTLGNNDCAPGPLIRPREASPVTVYIFNDTETTEFVHWHGQIIRADVDGAPQEKSLNVRQYGHLRYRLTPPGPAVPPCRRVRKPPPWHLYGPVRRYQHRPCSGPWPLQFREMTTCP